MVQAIKDSTSCVVLNKKLVQLELNVPIELDIEKLKLNKNLFDYAKK